jgi:hypothetical protein
LWFNLLPFRMLISQFFFKRNPKFQQTYHLSFSEEGIHFKTESIDSVIDWNHYDRTLESDQVFLMVYGPWMYSLIPKRAFKDITEIDAFRELMSRKISGKATRKSVAQNLERF